MYSRNNSRSGSHFRSDRVPVFIRTFRAVTGSESPDNGQEQDSLNEESPMANPVETPVLFRGIQDQHPLLI